MTDKLKYLFSALLVCCIFSFTACSGSDDDDNDGGEKLVLTSDENSIRADGTESVVFRVMYGPKDVSRDPAMHLTQTAGGVQTDLAAGENVFSTTAPGSYTFKANYSAHGTVVVSNEKTVTAEAATAYDQKLLGVQFTSFTCLGCPMLSTVLHEIQQEQPGRLIPVSFHVNYMGREDPMKINVSDSYLKKLNPQGALPRLYLNMHVSTEMSSYKEVILGEMEAEQTDYPAFCGVAVSTAYDASTRTAKISAGITSNTAAAFRYLIMLVEDGIAFQQAPDFDPDYIHNNVVRNVLSTNLYGERLNGGKPLEPGVEYRTSEREVAISDKWNPENMRVVVAAMVSHDGDKSYVCNNVNACKLGESSDYALTGVH